MTPGARAHAAIEVLDLIGAGEAAEKALTSWARRSRFAGSGDRAAVRDHVFQVLRCWRSTACLGGSETGRGRMIGALRAEGRDPGEVFTGIGHAPAPLTDAEIAAGTQPTGADALDLSDWLLDEFDTSLGNESEAVALALRARAPVMLRVDLRHGTRDQAVAALAEDDVVAAPHPIASTALHVLSGARRLARSRAYLDGLVELQDGSGQAAMLRIDLGRARRILDYCAGGGGKALALAARPDLAPDAQIDAHDVDPSRMKDLPVRAARVGAQIGTVATSALAAKPLYDIVLCDAPCSGSGTWRRTPEAKWRLTPQRLAELTALQGDILTKAAALVAPQGRLVYATCSVMTAENDRQIDAFIRAMPGWRVEDMHHYGVTDGGDGFFVAQMLRQD